MHGLNIAFGHPLMGFMVPWFLPAAQTRGLSGPYLAQSLEENQATVILI